LGTFLGSVVEGPTTARWLRVVEDCGGTVACNSSPDESKIVTVLLLIGGMAFATLEFGGAPTETVAPEFVVERGQGQDTALETVYIAEPNPAVVVQGGPIAVRRSGFRIRRRV